MASTSKGDEYILLIPQNEGNERIETETLNSLTGNQNFNLNPQNEDNERIEKDTPNLNQNCEFLNGYGWDDIHKAAFSADSQKLLDICRTLSRNQINSLTVLSENALHILLENSTKDNNFKICCQNGSQLTMCAVVNQEAAVVNKQKINDQANNDQVQGTSHNTAKNQKDQENNDQNTSSQKKTDDQNEDEDLKTCKKSTAKRSARSKKNADHKSDEDIEKTGQKSGDQNQENKDPKSGQKSIEKSFLNRLRPNQGRGDNIIDQNVFNNDQENSDQKMDYNESNQVNVSDQKVTYKKISSQKTGDSSPESRDRLELNQRKEDHKNEESDQETANQKTYRLTETEDEVYKCAEILIQSEINVNHPNFWNETPIVLALRYRRSKIVNLLLDVKNIDLDNCKDPISGKTPREILMLKSTKLCVVLPPKQPKPQNPLFSYLKSGNEKAFLQYNNGKISDLVNCLDGENEECSSCDLLQFCFRKSLIFWHQENRLDSDLQFLHQDVTANRMVQSFCHNGMAKCIQHLLDNNVNINTTLPKFQNNKTVLEAAISKGFYPIVALILGHKNCSLHIDKICQSLNDLIKSKTNNFDLNNTASIVLHKLLETPKDSNLQLVQVLENGYNLLNKDNILLLLKFPQSVSNASIDKIKPEILEEHLNDCLFRENGTILIDCQSFVKNKSMDTIFGKLTNSEKLIIHPVFKILIMRHWKHLRFYTIKYFYLVFIFFLIFYAFINVYILCDFNEYKYTHIVSYFLWFVLIIFIVKEGFQIRQAQSLKNYFLNDYSNIVEAALIVCVVLILVFHENWIDTIKILTILLSNFLLLFLSLGVPKYAKYIIIWKTIIFYMDYIIFYFVVFVAFASCFHILFFKDGENPLLDLPDRLFNTFILFTGNLDYMKTPWTEDSNTTLHHDFQFKEVFSKSIFTLFVIFIAIILQNLLLGLLVVDIQKINEQATIYEQVNRISFILKAENFFNEQFGKQKWIQNFLKYTKIQFEDSIEVNDEDKIVFRGTEDENVLEAILTKKSKKTNVLKKLKNYIENKIYEKNCKLTKRKKEITERLELIEENLKNLHDMNYVDNK